MRLHRRKIENGSIRICHFLHDLYDFNLVNFGFYVFLFCPFQSVITIFQYNASCAYCVWISKFHIKENKQSKKCTATGNILETKI